MHVMIDYPDEESETQILPTVRGEEKKRGTKQATAPIAEGVIFRARDETRGIYVS